MNVNYDENPFVKAVPVKMDTAKVLMEEKLVSLYRFYVQRKHWKMGCLLNPADTWNVNMNIFIDCTIFIWAYKNVVICKGSSWRHKR